MVKNVYLKQINQSCLESALLCAWKLWFKLIKIRAGFGEDYDNDDFVTLVDQNAIYAIPESKYSISNQADLNISTRKINENK